MTDPNSVDDHDLFRTGLSSLLASKPDFEVGAQASGGHMGVRLARELRPDVILMDLRMPDLSGEEATRMIVEHDPDVQVVVLTVAANEAAVTGAVRAGACGSGLCSRRTRSSSAPAARDESHATPSLPLATHPLPHQSASP